MADFANDAGGVEKVAVKLLRAKATNSDKEEFLSEAELMLLVSHPMVVKVWRNTLRM